MNEVSHRLRGITIRWISNCFSEDCAGLVASTLEAVPAGTLIAPYSGPHGVSAIFADGDAHPYALKCLKSATAEQLRAPKYQDGWARAKIPRAGPSLRIGFTLSTPKARARRQS